MTLELASEIDFCLFNSFSQIYLELNQFKILTVKNLLVTKYFLKQHSCLNLKIYKPKHIYIYILYLYIRDEIQKNISPVAIKGISHLIYSIKIK